MCDFNKLSPKGKRACRKITNGGTNLILDNNHGGLCYINCDVCESFVDFYQTHRLEFLNPDVTTIYNVCPGCVNQIQTFQKEDMKVTIKLLCLVFTEDSDANALIYETFLRVEY
jgi:hypothetical protein